NELLVPNRAELKCKPKRPKCKHRVVEIPHHLTRQKRHVPSSRVRRSIFIFMRREAEPTVEVLFFGSATESPTSILLRRTLMPACLRSGGIGISFSIRTPAKPPRAREA